MLNRCLILDARDVESSIKDRASSIQKNESTLKRAFWYISKALQVLGLLIVLVGILTGLSNPLGDAEFRAETRSAIIGVVVFAAGWLIEKKLAD